MFIVYTCMFVQVWIWTFLWVYVLTCVYLYRCKLCSDTCEQVSKLYMYSFTGVHLYMCKVLQTTADNNLKLYKCTNINGYSLSRVHLHMCTIYHVCSLTGEHFYLFPGELVNIFTGATFIRFAASQVYSITCV